MKSIIIVEHQAFIMKFILKIFILSLFSAQIFGAEQSIQSPFGHSHVVSSFVKAGDFVTQGQLIARLDTNDLQHKLSQLQADKLTLEKEMNTLQHLLKKTKTRHKQKIADKKQAEIDANQIISGLNNLTNLKNKAMNQEQLAKEIKTLSNSHREQRQLYRKLQATHKTLTLNEVAFESMIESADIKAPTDGLILEMVKVNQVIQRKGQVLSVISHA